MAGSIVMYLAFLIGPFAFPQWRCTFNLLFIGMFILHAAEISVARKAISGKNIPLGKIIVKTILYGFTWWLPVKKGIIEG